MRALDWVVLAGSLVFIVAYGLWRSRGSNTVNRYLLAGKTMPWYAMALSIMATQASAITFISTTGQAYVDGMRFVQFYFGLPIAMVIISATAVPIFHRAGVYTAYEYLERRFDAKTRALASVIFLIQRGLGVGLALYAPAIVLTVIFGWPDQVTTLIMGLIVIVYTVVGRHQGRHLDRRAADAHHLLRPRRLHGGGADAAARRRFDARRRVPGRRGRASSTPSTSRFDLNNRYNIWSGLIGGAVPGAGLLRLRPIAGAALPHRASIAQSRLSLLFNAMAKIPMQFFILFIGAMVFVFFLFERPPLLFQPAELEKSQAGAGYAPVEAALQPRLRGPARRRRPMVARRAARATTPGARPPRRAYRAAAEGAGRGARRRRRLAERPPASSDFNDTNYIFLTFVTRYLPAGIVGLIIAVIFAAAMSTISAEINSLATVTVIDIYRRHMRKDASRPPLPVGLARGHGLLGALRGGLRGFGKHLGSLIEAVNMLGSLFYGSLLGVFVLAFFFPRVTRHGGFIGMLAGEAAIFAAWFTGISFLWYNVIGCLVVVATALAVSYFAPES